MKPSYFSKSLFSLIVLSAIFLGCKKDDSSTVETKDKIEFFSDSPNKIDGLACKAQINNGNSVVYFYGSFNSKGLQDNIKSIVVEQKDSSFSSNYILDVRGRPTLLYTTKKDGTNDNVILKLSYPSPDTVVYSLYKYDWILQKDSLLQENRIHQVTGGNIITYGITDATEPELDPVEKEYKDMKDELFSWRDNALARVQALSGFNRLSGIWTTTITRAVVAGTTVNAALTSILLSIRENIVKARTNGSIQIKTYEETYGIGTTPPRSPSSQFIPNPIGTPQNPTGTPQNPNVNLPMLFTQLISTITTTTAIGGGNVTNGGVSPVITRGVCWSTSRTPTIANNKTIDGAGVGSFTSSITGLNLRTRYYVRAYATNSFGTAYGNELTFANYNAYFVGRWNQTSTNASYDNYYYTLDANGTFIVARNNTFNPLITSGGNTWNFYIDANNVSFLNLGLNNWKIKSFSGTSFIANRTNFNDNIDVFFTKY